MLDTFRLGGQLLLLTEGPPTQEDVKLIRDAWYGKHHWNNGTPETLGSKFKVVEWDDGPKYGCVVYRYSDKTYWYIRDLWQTYRKWLGPVIPFEVVPEKVEVIRYVRKNESIFASGS